MGCSTSRLPNGLVILMRRLKQALQAARSTDAPSSPKQGDGQRVEQVLALLTHATNSVESGQCHPTST